MRKTFHRHSWRQTVLLAAVLTTALLASATRVRAVIIYSSDTVATRNLDPPSESEGLAGWDLQATFGNFLATPIDPTHFIAAQHIYGDVGSGNPPPATITFQNHTYTVDGSSRTADPGSDLCIYSIVGDTFPTYATLYDESIDGSELNKPLTVIGRGTSPGASILVGGQPRGWNWYGSADGKQSWGQNVVAGFAPYSSDPLASQTALLEFDFSGTGDEEVHTIVGRLVGRGVHPRRRRSMEARGNQLRGYRPVQLHWQQQRPILCRDL